MAQVKEELLGLEVGQPLHLRADSSIFRGIYNSKVLAVDPVRRRVHVSAPLEKGKLVLIPVGTEVRLQQTGQREWMTHLSVLERKKGSERMLVLGEAKGDDYVSNKSLATPTKMEVLSVSSGKGGVGKTTFVVNLAVYLAQTGKKVCILDGDLGTANVDVVLGLAPKYNLTHVLSGQHSIMDVLIQGPAGINILPGGSGIQELTELDDRTYQKVLSEFCKLEEYIDLLLIDTSSGLARSVTNFIVAAGRGVVVCNPEPHAITDAYALIKVLAKSGHKVILDLVVNRVSSEKEARSVYQKISFASHRFLGVDIRYGGYVYEDELVRQCVKRQQSFVIEHPRSRVSRCIGDVSRVLWKSEVPAIVKEERSIGGIFGRMKSLFASR